MRSRLNPIVALNALLFVIAGCAAEKPINPTFPLTTDAAVSAWHAMAQHPQSLARPVVVLGGIYDPGLDSSYVADKLREIATPDAPMIHVSFFEVGTFDGCAKKLLAHIDDAFPTTDPHQTVAVDVIAYSMGGVVARYAASDESAFRQGRRVQIARLFTISSPHLGAKLAVVPTIDRRVIDMRSDSEFIAKLNAAPPSFEIIPYARLGDHVVGEENAAPPGRTPWWLSKSGGLSHALASHDVRILADIARRLRGEEPFSHEPPAPLPPRDSLAAAP